MPAVVTLRPARTEDAPAMARVFETAVLVRGQGAYGPRELAAWAAQGSAARFAAMLADPAKRLLAAETKAGLVGLAGLEGAEVILVYTAPDAPPGTGRQLLTAVEALARDSGQDALTLTASRNALSFYLRGGYRILSLAVRTLPGGEALPVCLMAKTLSDGFHTE